MRIFKYAIILCVCALLGACGKSVTVIQAYQFKRMADRMPAELEARGIIDSARYYRPTLKADKADERDDYGSILYARLAPDFVLEDTHGAQTFAATLTPRQRVTMRQAGFSIAEPRRTVHVDMVAIADWDDDGSDDWIIAATVERAGLVQRVFYALVQNPHEDGVLRGVPIAVFEDLGISSKLYLRDAKSAQPHSAVEESVPGLRPVTEPPDKNPVKKPATGVVERNI